MRKTSLIPSGLLWGAIIWLALIVPQAAYEFCFGSLSFTGRRLGFLLYSAVFCFGVGCVLARFRDNNRERNGRINAGKGESIPGSATRGER